MARYTVSDLAAWKKSAQSFAMLTAYDSVMASVFDQAGVPILLVGDSAGNNFLGHENTIPVTLDELVSLSRAVVKGSARALVIADLPFGSYEASKELALESSIRLLKEAGVAGVKLEGGTRVAEQVKALVSSGIPVMGHLGMTPQSVNAFGGFKVQGRDSQQADEIAKDALALQEAGAFAIVLELIPAKLASEITKTLKVPTIGIGAGSDCDGQVLVWTDLMGLTPKPPRFSRAYLDLRKEMVEAVGKWISDVESGVFPDAKESFD
ncbi:MAG: 3-methyl-2-oxobutanoate hydroxymethyltransferase [Actinobacteria bacterium]|nr:3-methyl-2-oxobutanoate hydroxymethyltransferase [Actinomycetota bacterium]